MLIPFERFSLISDNAMEKAISLLNIITDDRKIIFTSRGKYFKGKVSESGFKIERIIGYRNSFLPVIIGQFKVENKKVISNITMRLNIFVMVFSIIWLIGTFIGSISVLIRSKNINSFHDFTPFILFIFGVLLFIIPFKIEASIAKNELKEILGQEI